MVTTGCFWAVLPPLGWDAYVQFTSSHTAYVIHLHFLLCKNLPLCHPAMSLHKWADTPQQHKIRCSQTLLDGKRLKLFRYLHISPEEVCQNGWPWENESRSMEQVFSWGDGEGRSRSGVRVGKTRGGSETREGGTRRRLTPLQSRLWKSLGLSGKMPRERWWSCDTVYIWTSPFTPGDCVLHQVQSRGQGLCFILLCVMVSMLGAQ